MQIRLLAVPYMIGDHRHAAAAGAERLAQAAAERLGAAATVERIERGGPFRDSASASREVNRALAASIRRAIDDSELPIVLAGSCDAALGALGGFEHNRCGVVWFDAHADFNTPESTASGFFAGMSLAIVTGHCYANLWGQVGDATPVREADTLLIGVRDLSPAAERDRLERSGIRTIAWRDGKPESSVRAALEELASRVEEIYVHVDLDAFDPDVAPGIVDDAVPGGLSLQEMEDFMRIVAGRFGIAAAAVTTYTPDRDVGDKTLKDALRVVELIAEPQTTRLQDRR